jgi:hypothetical protein
MAVEHRDALVARRGEVLFDLAQQRFRRREEAAGVVGRQRRVALHEARELHPQRAVDGLRGEQPGGLIPRVDHRLREAIAVDEALAERVDDALQQLRAVHRGVAHEGPVLVKEINQRPDPLTRLLQPPLTRGVLGDHPFAIGRLVEREHLADHVPHALPRRRRGPPQRGHEPIAIAPPDARAWRREHGREVHGVRPPPAEPDARAHHLPQRC